MSIYTKYGDKGYTFTKISSKTPKNHILVNFLGNLDELNCFLGSFYSGLVSKDHTSIAEFVKRLMRWNFEIGAFIGYGSQLNFEKLERFISVIEQEIDEQEKNNPALQNFILPTGVTNSSNAHLCRAVARRVERSIYEMEIMAENELIIKFLNRISDYFFSVARTVNRLEGGEEIIWTSDK
jgi:cob(I)alamin adenosyltransferase